MNEDFIERLQVIKREFNDILYRDPTMDEIIKFFQENNTMHGLNNFIKNINPKQD